MHNEHQIIKAVLEAKKDTQKADDLIRTYIPFIRFEASKFLSRPCSEQDDEYSIAMIAFHEAILGYAKERGAFLSYAAMVIRSRLIDYRRKESRHQGHVSLYAQSEEDDRPLVDTIAQTSDRMEESINLEATQHEITLEACRAAIHYAIENPRLLDQFLSSKKLPMAQLVSGSGADRKTLERHRKYILVMLLVQTNGYEIIRGHLRHVLKKKGGTPV